MLDNFAFAGRHLYRDMGCEYYANDPRPLSPAVKRNEYQIAGRSGTVIYPGGEWQMIRESGIIVSRDDTDGETLYARMRRVMEWLAWPERMQGQIVFDSRPDVYREARIDAATAVTYGKWPRGALNITLVMQPIARALLASRQSMSVTEQDIALVLLHHTQLAAPLTIDILNTGASPITGCVLTLPERECRMALDGLSLAAGQTLRVSSEMVAAGAWIIDEQGDTSNAAGQIRLWGDLCAMQGDTLRITRTGGESMRVSVSARGCFL